MALSSARVAASGSMMGQAAGIAAACAADAAATSREVPAAEVIDKLRRRGADLAV
jgi:hypothetical protein